MNTVQLIRGYKIFLWADRLGIQQKYRNTELDVKAFYYVYKIIPVDDMTSKVIIITPVASDKGKPMPIMFETLNSTINLLVETFEIEE